MNKKFLNLLTLAAILISCIPYNVKVNAASNYPIILLSCYQKTLKIGDSFYLAAVSSNGSIPTFKSTSSKIASVTSLGEVTAKSPGTCKINVKDKRTEISCKITVTKTQIVLSEKSISIEHNESFKLNVTTSTKGDITYKSNKTSVAVVDENGYVTALKHGTALITATVDGIKKICEVTVKPPVIKLSKTSVTLKPGDEITLVANVSSGNTPKWISKKTSVAAVSQKGIIRAKKAGTAIITVSEDGAKAICTVTVKQK